MKKRKATGAARIAKARSKNYSIVKARGRGKSVNTRYGRRIRKGVYQYRLKSR